MGQELARIEREMMKATWWLPVAVVFGGCATHTGVVPVGKGLYMASKMDYTAWSAGAIKGDLFREATLFCQKSGQEVVVEKDRATDASMAGNYASAEIQFRCE